MEFANDEKMTKNKVWPSVNEILSRRPWFEDDITVLMAHADELDDDTRAELGLDSIGNKPAKATKGDAEKGKATKGE